MKVFVTGAGGQLGHDIMKELRRRGHEGIGSDVTSGSGYLSLDITDAQAVSRTIAEIKPDVVIHCRGRGGGRGETGAGGYIGYIDPVPKDNHYRKLLQIGNAPTDFCEIARIEKQPPSDSDSDGGCCVAGYYLSNFANQHCHLIGRLDASGFQPPKGNCP